MVHVKNKHHEIASKTSNIPIHWKVIHYFVKVIECYLITKKKGWSAMKEVGGRGIDIGIITTAVEAAASVPSSFT